jgi:hypothetical protein
MVHQRGPEPFVVAVIGAGPRGTGVLERLLANVGEFAASRPVRVEVVDPYPPGAGRVWREDQPELMWMNAVAGNITMFTDDSVQCAGPIRPGPSLCDWAATDGGYPELDDTAFASRRIQSRYLVWVFDHIVAHRPANVEVRTRRTLAVGIEDAPDDRQLVWLQDRAEPLVVDAAVLALGHLDEEPAKEERLTADFASRHDLRYLPRSFSVDADLSVFRPGENVVMRGFGLAFIDLMVLLTEMRGGRYEEDGNGELRYLPSGDEPRLYVGSRRGVPYQGKFTYPLVGGPLPLPTFFDAEAVNARFADRHRINFRNDLWPLIAKEIAWAYYHELFTAHPDRVALSWHKFADRYTELDWDSAAMLEIIEAAVPDVADRLDFATLDRPLKGVWFDDCDGLREYLREYIARDIEQRRDPRFSPHLAAYQALWATYGQMADVLAANTLTARSYVEDVSGWWQGFVEYVGSGPPSIRLRQLLALSKAGIVHFLGSEMWVTTDEEQGVFRAGSVNTAHEVVATGMIEARLPAGGLRDCGDELLRQMHANGGAAEHVLLDEDYQHPSGRLHVSTDDFRVLDRSGRAHPRRFALGPYTNVSYFATFARPGVNALSFRQNDRLARGVLGLAATPEHTRPTQYVSRKEAIS